MAASPGFKIYNREGVYLASTKFTEEAAVLMAFLGDGATIRTGHAKADIVWTEGEDGEAGESYDAVGELVEKRREARLVKRGAAQVLKRFGRAKS
jgi:hypothetical protein